MDRDPVEEKPARRVIHEVRAIPIAFGRTADIHPWGKTQIVKLLRPGMSRQDAERERHNTSLAHALGLRTPAAGPVIRSGKRIGLVLERIEGRPMLEKLLMEPDPGDRFAHELAELHLEVHRHVAPEGFPDQEDVLVEKITSCELLSPSEQAVLIGAMRELPDGQSLCHGDFHPGNVMLPERGPVIIDWPDASRGNPVADVARTSLLLLGHLDQFPPGSDMAKAMTRFHEAYLDRYLEREPGRRSEYRKWLPIMAAARLVEGIDEQQDWLLAQVRKRA